MFTKPAPFAILIFTAVSGFAATAVALLFALEQPWLGIRLAAPQGGDQVWVAGVDRHGPVADLPTEVPLLKLDDINIEAGDLVAEPENIATNAALARFYDRQQLLYDALAKGEVTLETGAPKAASVTVRADHRRPLLSLPPMFWFQIGIGFVSMMIGAWVWSLKRGFLPARLLALAGACTLFMIHPIAIYSTREIALPADLYFWLLAIGHLGAAGFGVAMVALFFVYPRRVVAPAWLWLLAGAIGVWWLADMAWQAVHGSAKNFLLVTFVLLPLFFWAVFLQLRETRGDPAARAVLGLFALTFGVSAMMFTLVAVVPNILDWQPVIEQGYLLGLFLVVFIGVAVGVARYRLFELEEWAFSVLFYFGGVVIIVLLDAALIGFVAIERVHAFGISLISVALVYLPARDYLMRRLSRTRDIDREELFRRIVDVALTANAREQQDEWRQVLCDVFLPLQLSVETEALETPRIDEEGLALVVPGVGSLTPTRLSCAYGGRRLFGPRDRRFAAEICSMLAHAIASRDAHEQGAATERARIARDMHDNIGAQLLSALHSDARERKDTLIRATISDLRDIINNGARGGKSLGEALADLKLEVTERLSVAGIALDWQDTGDGCDAPQAPNVIHSLRSILREAVSNTIRHSVAGKMTIRIEARDKRLRLVLFDNGQGADPTVRDNDGGGNGLSNIEARITALKGTLLFDNAKPGFAIRAEFPLQRDTRP